MNYVVYVVSYVGGEGDCGCHIAARAQPRSLVILIIKVCDIQIFEPTSEISQGDNHSTTSAPCSSGTYNRLWAAAGRLPMI